MKMGMSWDELAAEVERQAGAMQDLVVPVKKLEAVVAESGGKPEVRLGVASWNKKTFRITQQVHTQLARYTGIAPRHYWEMQVKAPERLAREVNRSLKAKANDTRTLRTLGGAVLGLLGESDRGIGNEDVVKAVLPVLKKRDLRVMSCFIIRGRLYIKAVDRSIERDVPTGRKLGDGSHIRFDTISPGIVISNSEVDEDSFSIETSIFTLACTNLAIGGRALRKYDLDALLRDETGKPTAAAIRNRIHALVISSLDEANLEAEAQRLKVAVESRIELDEAVEVVERAGAGITLTEGEKKSVLQHFVEGADFTRYGLQAAVTRASADVEDYDRATELERLGGRVIALPSVEWNPILEGLPHVPRVTLRAVS
jgi:hypothetical protein